MDAHKIWMLRDFVGANKVLFKIPVYQRNYDWSESNCTRLLSDIKKLLSTQTKHFLGAVVFMADKNNSFSLQEYIIIDGQQRLTTIMLMLKALADASISIDDNHKAEIEEEYLHNKYCDEIFKIKLKPVKTDNEQFQLLLKNQLDKMDPETHIYKNYLKCHETFQSWISAGISPKEIINAMAKLEIVEIVLTKGEDDPQIIFESINSTGLELTNSDLIRNFLLMSADDQEALYETYWLPLEKSLKKGFDYSNLDLFFTQYLIYKTNSTVSSKHLYEKFVKLFEEQQYTQESMLIELKYFSDIFKTFVYGNTAFSPAINKSLEKIRLLKQTTCYPFLFHIFDDYNNNIIDCVTFEKTLEFIASYLLRRIVCKVPSNSLRTLFIYLYGRVFKVTCNKQKYYESINKFLHTLASQDMVPSENDFKRYLKTSNIYSNVPLSKFLLMDIENGDSKETLHSSNLTIEHIMPQSLGADWKHISSETHDEWLHTLGNLSVTGYNSELSNKSFHEKKEIIQKNSKAVILNSDVLNKTTWGEAEIICRAERLCTLLISRYKIESILDPSIEFEYVREITLEDYSDVTGKKLVSFSFENDIYRQNKYIVMVGDIIKLLYSKQPDKINQLAQSSYSFNTSSRYTHLSTTDKNMRYGWLLLEGIYIESNLSAASCLKFIDSLLEEFNLEKSIFSINVLAENSTEDDEYAETDSY